MDYCVVVIGETNYPQLEQQLGEHYQLIAVADIDALLSGAVASLVMPS